MNCVLMHQRIAVLELELDDVTGFIRRTGCVFAAEHLPVGVMVQKGIADRAALQKWWMDRFPQAGQEFGKRWTDWMLRIQKCF